MKVFSQLFEGGIGTVNVIIQCVTALNSVQPLIKWVVKMVKVIRCNKLQSKNSKLRAMAFAVADGVVNIITQQPGGYTFWGLLPIKGLNNKHALRKKIASYLLSSFFSDAFLTILLQSALTVQGRPQENSQLYYWLLNNVYSGDVQRLYSDWLKSKGKSLIEV